MIWKLCIFSNEHRETRCPWGQKMQWTGVMTAIFFFAQRFSLLIYFNFSDLIMIATMYGMCKLTILLTKPITGRL